MKVWEKWYGDEHADPQMTHDAVYSMPEMNRELAKGKKLIANPGCSATAARPSASSPCSRPATPVAEHHRDRRQEPAFAGAAAVRSALNKLLTEAENNFCAYALGGGHRHTPEIEQNIAYITGKDLMKPETWQYINFQPRRSVSRRSAASRSPSTPPAIRTSPTRRSTSCIWTSTRTNPSSRSSRPISPCKTKWACGTNFVEMTPTFDSRTHRLIVSSVIDNIGKGAAGQAIQNMNLIMGLPETTGLMMPPMYP